jgi:hypothetical protein
MKIFVMITGLIFICGCVSRQKISELDSSAELEINSRAVASENIDQQFNEYFIVGNFQIKLKKTLAIAKQFLASMPDKGHAKKRLVKQFVFDLTRVTNELDNKTLVKAENNHFWLPLNTRHPEYISTVRLIGSVVQSGKIMQQMGIYLSASGVVEEDSASDRYYFEMLARALSELESEISKLVIAYPPEQKNTDENNARLQYVKRLANEIRTGIRKNFQSNNTLDIKKIDRIMLQLAHSITLKQANLLLKNSDYIYTKSVMADLHISDSQDIMGFEEDVDLTLATKFSFSLINELISKVR